MEEIVLPKQFKKYAFKELHNKMVHLGFGRVAELYKNRFYRWKYESHIKNYATKRCKCLEDTKLIQSQRALLNTISTTQPFELITIDYLQLDQCKGRYEYLLVVVDHFVKFAHPFPTKNKSGKFAADMLFNKYFLELGFPKGILHDQGKEFDNILFKRLSEITEVIPSRTTPYHLMGNRLCERMNQKLLNMLKTLPTNFKTDRKSYVKTFAHNNTIHKATGFSLHFHLFGRNGRLPIDLLFDFTNIKTTEKIIRSK